MTPPPPPITFKPTGRFSWNLVCRRATEEDLDTNFLTYNLLNDAVNNSDYMVSNDMINENEIKMILEGSGRGIF
jgi:hypothetical protein